MAKTQAINSESKTNNCVTEIIDILKYHSQ